MMRPLLRNRFVMVFPATAACRWVVGVRGEAEVWKKCSALPGELMGGMLLLWLSGEMVSQKSVLRR
jgi:hypothetical protein